jgi:hypothetical protein
MITNTVASKIGPVVRKNGSAPAPSAEFVVAMAALQAENAQHKAELEALKAKLASKSKGARAKVGPKGGISAYVGGQRFPIGNAYANQWEEFFADGGVEKVKALIAEGRSGKLFEVDERDDDGKATGTRMVPMSFDKK